MAERPPAMQYADDVVNGRIIVNEWTRLAVERHLHDLEHGHERGLYFDEAAAWRIIIFCRLCKHYKGEFAGRVFEPEPWQQFFLWVMFGWKKITDGFRRFRVFHLEIARKNGKTYLGAVIGLYLTYADNEPGAEVYSVATKKDQAKICHQDAMQIVKKSGPLSDEFTVLSNSLCVEESVSKFEPLGRDSDSLDGLNVHGAIMDELHAWKKRELWDVIETATGSRRQPLIGAITTAGFNRHTICWDQHIYLKKILSGIIEDDAFFGMIFSLDNESELDDEAAWGKANPNLGVSINLEDLRSKIERAKNSPALLNAVMRLRLNIWTQAESRWIHPEKWRACSESKIEEQSLVGRPCYGGLDLSQSTDITALVYVFPPIEEDESYKVLARFFVPEDNVEERSRRDRVPYDVFVRQGYLTETPGSVIDYAWITAQIENDMQKYQIQEIAYDAWGATKIIQSLQDIMPKGRDASGKEIDRVVLFRQGFASMSPPMKELEKMIFAKKIDHGGNPVLTWMADNVVAVADPAGNMKPDKSKSIEKIDGIVALIMALDRALHGVPTMTRSIYEQRGLRSV